MLGLQVFDPISQQWLPVRIPTQSYSYPNTSNYCQFNYKHPLVINAGDLIQRWANDYWKSPLHRVIGPVHNSPAAMSSRYSLVFFTGPYEDAMIDTLDLNTETFVGQKDSKYESILSGEHLRLKLMRSNV